MKKYPETHQQGIISFEQNINTGWIKGDIGIQIASNGKIWICIDGKALIRFQPLPMKVSSKRTLTIIPKQIKGE